MNAPPSSGGVLKQARELYERYLDARAFRVADRFFRVPDEASGPERRAWSRHPRAQARLEFTSAGYRAARIVVVVGLAAFLGIVLLMPMPLGVRWLLHPSSAAARRAFLTCLAYAVLAWPIVTFVWLRDRRITRAVKELSEAMGGTWGRGRFLSVLDWLDASWPADAPMEVLDAPSLGERRWDLQTSHGGRPVLVLVQRRWGSRRLWPVQRISFYLSAPSASPPLGYDPAPTLRELSAMGLWAKRTSAGVYIAYPRVSPEMLDPGRVHRALELAHSLAAGSPLFRAGPLGGSS